MNALNKILLGICCIIALSIFGSFCASAETANWNSQLPDYTYTTKQQDEWNKILRQFPERTDADFTNDVTVTSGDVIVATGGKGIVISTNSASPRLFRLTLVAGRATGLCSTITAKTHFVGLSHRDTNSVVGTLAIESIAIGTNFVVVSKTNNVVAAGDVSVVEGMLVEATP